METLSDLIILVGALLALIAGAGLQRFPDALSRMHAATKPATLGLALVLVGAAFRVGSPDAVAKLLLVAALQFITAPVGAHMLGRSAYRSGAALDPPLEVDELAGFYDPPDDGGAGGEG